MNSKRAWLVYSVIRLLAFAVPFAVVMLALPAWQWNWLAGALIGAVISACISVIFLRGTRQQMGDDLQRLTERKDARTADDKDEDAALDSTAETEAAEPVKATSETEPAEADPGEEPTPDSSPQRSPSS
ncbi:MULTISPECIES: DUF4229 domain-containing protein [unclassified Pseudoclavibacter]|uniref:DUF4229 domain-containing protein n=1 Tax=unclassified Pseudoclavibacter TaxID=2615177 RepID=UPI000CE8147B|nr:MULTISPECIES: DUF4229 domain-containing protein [unclassified Pseudoclavibacter]MBS3178957.1 DUF4229 domain-containing protein [Pseudoclavibacter sp. Marseille-Q4354]PPG32276.1 hypothetical protein C5B97_04300 [Pseudoclavibacter sp. RFBB5]